MPPRQRDTTIPSRLALLAPFVLGGAAAGWLAGTAEVTPIVVIGWTAAVLAAGTIVLLLTAAPSRARRVGGRFVGAAPSGTRWHARPASSRAVRALAVFAPIAVSVSVAIAAQRMLAATGGLPGLVTDLVLPLLAGLAVLYPAERATRRLAPIAMLLRLSLAFPSSAPSRFRVARRSSDPSTLRRRLEDDGAANDRERSEVAAALLALLAALTAHDARTRGHSERVRVFSEMLGEELGLAEVDRERLRWAALLHDIGKLAVSAEVLNKPGPLDATQWQAIYRHPEAGARLIAPLASWLGPWAGGIVQHHERVDGSGYPDGLRGEDISLSARIIAVADAFDTMVTPRSYRGAMAPEAARREVATLATRQFDPRVVRALLSISIPRLWWRIGVAAWLAQAPLIRWAGSRPRNAAAAVPLASIFASAAAIVAMSALGLLGGAPGVTSGTSGSAGRTQAAVAAPEPPPDPAEAVGDAPPPGGAGASGAAAGGGAPGRGGGAAGAGGAGAGGGPGGGSGNGVGGDVVGTGEIDGGAVGGEGAVGGAGEAVAPPADEPAPPTPPPAQEPATAHEPGRNGSGNAFGHEQRIEDGKGLPPGQVVSEGEPPGLAGRSPPGHARGG